MSIANVTLRYKDLMIIDHAIRHYVKRPGATERDLKEENLLLDWINDNIKITRGCSHGAKEQKTCI